MFDVEADMLWYRSEASVTLYTPSSGEMVVVLDLLLFLFPFIYGEAIWYRQFYIYFIASSIFICYEALFDVWWWNEGDRNYKHGLVTSDANLGENGYEL